ncbi:intracellular signaling protein [Aliidiomarina minuta]|uniref:Intracellular signaling protein n=1 Tax=Aliidiomarina minuta TaxID=880057 RepID=A0A432W130_9GAMM|nr:HDOD domain-containing protein [Aliidiomarina minuta]RUO22932.1 intracellular signaling protein [Aliidiomarina minuta]
MNILFASQPIYNRQLEIAGSELLYRHDDGLTAFDVGEDIATSEVLFNLCTGISEQFEQTDRPVYLNVTASFLHSGAFLPVKPDHVVVELTERIQPDNATIRAIENWHDQGFRFALDDFEFKPEWDPLLKLASIVKVDISKLSLAEAIQHKDKLASYDLTWLAERVENQNQLELYMEQDFDLFQGYFLARPTIISGQKITTSGLQLASLLQKIFAQEAHIEEVADAISNEPALSISLLKIANSPMYRTAKEVTSIKDVVIRLGLELVKKWVTLISSLQCNSPANVHIALTRAFTCAELAKKYTSRNVKPEQAFFAALLSASDILLNVDKKAFVSSVNVSTTIAKAALKYAGNTGMLVKAAHLTERSIHSGKHSKSLKNEWIQIYQEQSQQVQLIIANR